MEADVELKIANEIMKTVNRLGMLYKLDALTEGRGNCFPLAVIAQCRRKEIFCKLERRLQTLIKVGDPTQFRYALRNFALKSDTMVVKNFRKSYDQVVAPIDNRCWTQYWDLMTRNYEWVDSIFIQVTAWFINHDIRIIGTTARVGEPFITISGNLSSENHPCNGSPLILGCKSNVHYQSLLPIESNPERSRNIISNQNLVDTPGNSADNRYCSFLLSTRTDTEGYNISKNGTKNMKLDQKLKSNEISVSNENTSAIKTFSYKIGNNFKIFEIFSDKRIRCPFCTKSYKNIQCHIQKSNCSVPNFKDFSDKLHNFILQHFEGERKQDQRDRKAKSNAKLRAIDNEKFKAKNVERRVKSDAKLRHKDNQNFKNQQANRRAKSDAKVKDSNPEKFKDDQSKRQAKLDCKLREQDNEKFKDKQAKRRAKSDAKLKDSNPEKFKDDQTKRRAKLDAKLREEDTDRFKY